jgi:hypothetical protein
MAMTILELQLDEQTMAQAQRVAEQRQATLETLVADIIASLAALETKQDPWWGLFADEPALLDEVVALAMTARERDPLRVDHG